MLLLTKCLFLQRARSNMVPFNFALEANNLGQILDLFLALLLLVYFGLLLVVRDKSKSTLVIGGFLHSQHIVKCGLPLVTLIQVFLQRSDLGQIELLTSNYGKLGENHENLSSSREDLLFSCERLKLAHGYISNKVKS